MLDFVLTYWVEFFLGLIVTLLTFYLKKIRNKLEEQEAVKKGVIALLHDRLFQSCMYFIDKGEIGLLELDNINEIYRAYQSLGGNGTGSEIVERANDLPIKK